MKTYLKKSIAIILALLCMMNLSVASFAEPIYSGSCGDSADWSFDEATGVLTISGEGEMYDYSNDGLSGNSPWRNYLKKIKEIVISDDITYLGQSAFFGCTEITEIVIPEGVETIAMWALGNCRSLSSVSLPESVMAIGPYAFLKSVNISEVYYAGNCEQWLSIDFEPGVFDADAENTKLYFDGVLVENLVIPDGVKAINDFAFSNCESITSVVVSDSVETIGESAFYNCDSIQTIDLPESLTTIGESAFENCDGITHIEIPNGVTWTGVATFRSCSNLSTVSFGENLLSIGKAAFYNCDSIQTIDLPESLEVIGENAFEDCDGLSDIVIPVSVASIAEGAFNECEKLNTIYYEGPEDWWDEVTYGSSEDYLTKNVVFNYGKDVGHCGQKAIWSFDETSGTLVVSGTGEIDANLANWNHVKDQVTYVEVGNGITAVGAGAFDGFTMLNEVYFADSVSTIGADAFADCGNLAIVTILADNVSLANDAFANTDSRLFFVVKSGSQSHSVVADAGFAVSPFSIGTEEIMDNLKTLIFEGRTVFYDSLGYNYMSNLMFDIPDLYYVKFEKLVLDGIISIPDFSIDIEIPEENIEPDEEFLTLKDVYISVVVDGEKVSFEELRERMANGDYSGFIFTDYVEDGMNSSFFESVAEFFGQLTEDFQEIAGFITAAFDAVINTVSKLWKKLFGN